MQTITRAKKQIINYFRSYLSDYYGEDPVLDIIDSHSRQRYIISCYRRDEKELMKVPKSIRKLFGSKV